MPSSARAPHRPLYVTVVYQGKCSHCMRIGVAVPISGTVARLREAVSSETKIPTEQVRPGLLTWVPSPRWEGQWRLLSRVGYGGIEICCPWLNREARKGWESGSCFSLWIGCLNPSGAGIALSGVSDLPDPMVICACWQ